MMTKEEYTEYRRLEIAIDLGGNDGADIYDFECFCQSLEERYGMKMTRILEEYVMNNPDCR